MLTFKKELLFFFFINLHTIISGKRRWVFFSFKHMMDEDLKSTLYSKAEYFSDPKIT